MKIRALRVREVGCLREPATLEGLSGGLDVLAGPNELGKSTLFRALEAVFTVLHTSKVQGIRDWMVPDNGGAPVIEVDFELGAKRYRLRKQYFVAPKASLLGLDDGTQARGADAEARLAELLIGAGGADRLGLLWVRQTGSLAPFTVDTGTRAGLKGLIERELFEAAGGRKVHAVRKLVGQRLEALVTGKRRQPRGALKEAIDRQTLLRSEREQLLAKVTASQAALDCLGVLRASHADLVDPAAKAQRAERTAAARSALEAARAATEKRRTAEEASGRLQHENAAAAAALAAYDARAGELAALAEQLDQMRARQTLVAIERREAHEREESGTRALGQEAAAEHALREQLETARRSEAAAAQRVALSQRLSEAVALTGHAAELQTRVAANRVTAEVLRAAEAENRAIERTDVRPARIEIVYDRGAEGRIAGNGKPIPESTSFEIGAAAEFVVAGVGRIRVTPSGVDAKAMAVAEAARKRLGEILASAGAADMPEMNALAGQRAEQASELAATTARIKGLCPEGLEQLRLAAETLAGTTPIASSASLAVALANSLERRKNAEAANRNAQTQTRQIELGAARLEAEIASLGQRREQLLGLHPTSEAAAGMREALANAATATTTRAQQALLELSAHRALEPDNGQIAGLERELAATITAVSDVTAKTHAEATEMAMLVASLKRDALDGIAERLAECEGELLAAEKRLAPLTREVAALALLDEQFDAVEADTRARYLGPVTDRLRPYLETVLPGAGLMLGDTFGAETILRDGRTERLERLSEGTREQVAVLVRLGLARLLADTGEPLPLILDDALVYSDDDRMAKSFTALLAAAEHHQIVLLTCRTRAFHALGGTRLKLGSWQGFAD